MTFTAEIRTTIDMCRHCFMCRHANPTFLVTKLDAHTPRGYALGLSRVDDGLTAWAEDLVEKLFQSTLDGLCSELCEFHWREDLVVQAGRAEAVRHGLAPASVVRAAERRMDGTAAMATPPPIEAGRLDRAGAKTLFITGIGARDRAPETISAMAAILDHWAVDWTALSIERDCGIDLWELGYDEAADVAAEHFVTDVRAIGPARILTGSARVLRALREPRPSGLAGLPPVEHLSEFLQGHLAGAGDRCYGSDVATVAYHDPCSLGRRARVLDAPRAAIADLTGSSPVEFPHFGETAECCGEGGLLPEIDPALARRMAEAQLARMPEDVDTLVTACPSCRAQLSDAAEGIRVLDLSELAAERLGLG